MTFSNWTPVQAAPMCALSHKSSRQRVRGPPNVKKYNTALNQRAYTTYVNDFLKFW